MADAPPLPTPIDSTTPPTPDAVLAALQRDIADTPVHYGAAHLDFRGKAWTAAHRAEVVRILATQPARAIDAVLAKVARNPRSGVCDAAVDVLRGLATTAEGTGVLLRAWEAHVDVPCREVLLRCLGDGPATGPGVDHVRAALSHADPSIREAAVWAMFNIDPADLGETLTARLAVETDTYVRESLADALGSMPDPT